MYELIIIWILASFTLATVIACIISTYLEIWGR